MINLTRDNSERRRKNSFVTFKIVDSEIYMFVISEVEDARIVTKNQYNVEPLTVESLGKTIDRKRDCSAIHQSILDTIKDGRQRSVIYYINNFGTIEKRRIDLVRSSIDSATGRVALLETIGRAKSKKAV